METIDELVPIEEQDLNILQAKKNSNFYGCGVFMIIISFGLLLLGYFNLGGSYLWLSIIVIISVLFLIASLLAFWMGPIEDKKVALDIKDGKKRRIIAPIESKDIQEVQTNKRRSGLSVETKVALQAIDSYSGPNLKYSMTVHGFTFDLSEQQYLSSFRKGDFVEFYVAPNSNIILSPAKLLEN